MNKTILKMLKVIVITALITTAIVFITNTGLKMLKQKKYDDVQTDLLLIQAKVRMIKGKADVNSNSDGFVGTKVSESGDENIKELFKSLQISEEDFDKYYVLSLQDFENIGIKQELKNLEDNCYIVNYETAEVIFKSGVEIDKELKYRLSDIMQKNEKKVWILHNRSIE